MRYQEILEACWSGYQQQGMKKKGDRMVPNCVPVEEQYGDPFIDNAARELLAMVLMFGVPFVAGVYIDLRNKLRKYQGKEIIDALERKGVTMNRQTYEKVKPVLDRFDQAIRDDDGTEARALAKQIEQMIIMGKLSAPEPRPADTALAAKERELEEDLKKWFKEKWVRFGPDGKIRGACARGSESEGKPKCLPQSKAHALGKKGRASAAAKKRREDPNPERRGPARNVATKVREQGVAESSVDNHAKLSWVAKKLASETGIPGDRKDFLKAAKRFDRGYTTGGMDIIYDMDTDPRDDFFNYCDHYGAVYEQGVAEGFEYGSRVQHPKYGTGQIIKVYSNGVITVNFANYPDPIDKKPGIQSNFGPGDKDYQSLKPVTEGMTDYQKRRQRERDVDAGRPVKPLPKNPKTDYQKRREQERRDMEMGEAVTLDRNKVPDYPQDPATVKHRTDTAKAILGDPKSDPDSRREASRILATIKQIDEKQDACYRKVKSRYKVWPSAYASGALVQCRKKGAANWGTGGKKK